MDFSAGTALPAGPPPWSSAVEFTERRFSVLPARRIGGKRRARVARDSAPPFPGTQALMPWSSQASAARAARDRLPRGAAPGTCAGALAGRPGGPGSPVSAGRGRRCAAASALTLRRTPAASSSPRWPARTSAGAPCTAYDTFPLRASRHGHPAAPPARGARLLQAKWITIALPSPWPRTAASGSLQHRGVDHGEGAGITEAERPS
jgi:hypothetical protein